MSHADELMRLATAFAEAEAQSKWDGDCERASQSESRKSDEIRDSARAAIREACEKLCGPLERNLVLISKFAMSHRYCPMCHAFLLDQMHSAACPIVVEHDKTTAALAHLTKGTA